MLPAVEYLTARTAEILRRLLVYLKVDRTDEPEEWTVVPNRADRRAEGYRPGLYRQPRGLPRRTGRPGWWPKCA